MELGGLWAWAPAQKCACLIECGENIFGNKVKAYTYGGGIAAITYNKQCLWHLDWNTWKWEVLYSGHWYFGFGRSFTLKPKLEMLRRSQCSLQVINTISTVVL
jgi:hypothetical protein